MLNGWFLLVVDNRLWLDNRQLRLLVDRESEIRVIIDGSLESVV